VRKLFPAEFSPIDAQYLAMVGKGFADATNILIYDDLHFCPCIIRLAETIINVVNKWR
jgi:hypothetical protein